jgi:hypothetical protein
VQRKYHPVAGGAGPGFVNSGEYDAPPFENLLKQGFPSPQ